VESNDFDPTLFIGASSDPLMDADVSDKTDTPVETTPAPSSDAAVTDVTPPATPAVLSEPALDAVEWKDLTPRERMLLDRLERVTGEKLSAPVADPKPALDQPVQDAVYNFLDGLDVDEVLSSAETLNKVLLAVYNRALQEGTKLATENVLRSTPQAISQYVTQHMTMREMVKEFYDTNPELASVKRTVAAVANEISAEKPELSLEDLFREAGERVYKMLGLKKAATKSAAALVRPRGSSGRVKAPALQGLAAEVSDLFDIR